MTAVIYARYSSDNQREESIEGQIRECTAYAEKNDITIVKHYIDRAISAKTDNRPQFQQMIKDSDKKLFDIVLVWKLDRFARNRYDSARYKTQLKKNGVKLMSATEIISEGPEGIILESVLEGYAEYYSADLSEKVIRGMTENALKGKFTGGAIPFGYIINADHRFEIDPLTAPFVAETFQRYNDGQTMREIRDWLNEKGVKNQRGGLMTFNTIQHMLNNRRYIGELKYRDVLIPDAIPSIVSAELFNDVQEKIAKNKKAPARRKAEDDYLLTTKPVSYTHLDVYKRQNHSSVNDIYPGCANNQWTCGFWPGEIWLAYEATGDEKFKTAALIQVDSFADRIARKVEVDHHDMGFLYSPTCVAAWKLVGSEKGKNAAIAAADQLLTRYQPSGRFLQAWGTMDDPGNYRYIIDCMLNVPLLYWAAQVTGSDHYREIAAAHTATTLANSFRPDGSTYHTFFMNPDGTPKGGRTCQGYKDDSFWARGQAWGCLLYTSGR